MNPFPAAFFLLGVDVLQVGLMLQPNDGVLVNHSTGIATATYTGAGDLVSGASAWYGLRGYSNAVAATGTQKAINIRRTSDSATTDILILPNGDLDVATASAFLAATTGFVVTWYDQSGNGRDATQATTTKQPQLIFNAIGTHPAVSFVGASVQVLLYSGALSGAQPWSMSVVAEVTHATSSDYIFAMGNSFARRIDVSTNANIGFRMYAGGGPINAGVTTVQNTFYPVQFVASGVSSVINMAGTETTGNASTGALTTPLGIGSDGTNEGPLTGAVVEAGLWPVGLSLGNRAAMYANQKAYWGTA